MPMLFQEMKKLRTVQQNDRFAKCKLMGIRSVISRCHKNALASAFVNDGSKEISHGGNADGIRVTFGLNDDFANAYGIRVKGDCVNSAIATSPCNLDFTACGRKLFFKQLSNKVFEIRPIHRSKIFTFDCVNHITRWHEAAVFYIHIHFHDWGNWRKVVQSLF